MNQVEILKTDGQTEPFDRAKLRDSLLKASTSMIVTDEIVQKVENNLVDGMTSSEIYRIAFDLLNEKEKRHALKYSMRRSLLTLGPTGFPFEKFISRIFHVKGYKTIIGEMVAGKCVEHEIDLIAYNKNELALIEVKFHNSLGIKTDTKVALYVKARFDDLKDQELFVEGQKRIPTRGILITNTKFTHNAEKYAACNNLGMISWDYPKKGNLYDLIEETDSIPLTTLTSLSKSQKDALIESGYICCVEIKENPNILQEIRLNESEVEKVMKEINLIEENQKID